MKQLHCNNNNCTDREICALGGMWSYGTPIVYGMGSNSNECTSFASKDVEVTETDIDDFLTDSDGIGAV